MALIKLGDYIELCEERNTNNRYTLESVRGIATSKCFISTKANMDGVPLHSYKLVAPLCFAYVADTSRRGDKISIALNMSNETYLVSSISTVFKTDSTRLIPEYLFLIFNRPEFDRYSRFNSWGSARETFSWDELCNITLELPSIDIQQKYVNIYKAMVANLKAYQTGLDDLKLVCDSYIENLRKKLPCEPIGKYINRIDIRNGINGTKNVMGVSTAKEFREPTSKVNKDELSNYKVVQPRQFSFVQTTHNEKVFAYALNNTKEDIVVTPVNEVFSVDENLLLPEYLALFFSRKEFDRYARFHSWGSARETFTWNDLIEVKIPIPPMQIQQSITRIYRVYKERKDIKKKIEKQISSVCSILIKGSIEEARRKGAQ